MSATKMKIGEVHALLRQQFPDIELSKIRYYEEKGLVHPSRSRKGYRLYEERDVACLREAIRLACEEFVPLRVIRLRLIEQGMLDDVDASSSPRAAARAATVNVVQATAPVPTAPVSAPPVPTLANAPVAKDVADDRLAVAVTAEPPTMLTLDEMLHESGARPEWVNELIALGLVKAQRVAGESLYTRDDLRLVTLSSELFRRGVASRYVGTLRRIVDRQVSVVEELTESVRGATGRRRPGDAAQVVDDVARAVEALRTELFQRAIQEFLGH